jgi:hypothetical protein
MRPSRPAYVVNPEAFGFPSSASVERLGDVPLRVTLDLGPFPAAGPLSRLAPSQREGRIRSHYRRLFERLRPSLPEGTRPADRDSRRCDCTVPARALRALRRHPSVQRIWLRQVPGSRGKTVPPRALEWYAVKARFAIQVEGVTRGLQRYEDRIVIVQARHPADAVRRLRPEFRAYGAPYIGATNLLVRWQFEDVLDIYAMGQVRFDAGPVEVFSTLRSRRLRPETAWVPRRPSR